MAFRFDQNETPGIALRRIVLEVLGDAQAVLRVPPDGDAEIAVHEARKSVKKARAALRLGRELLDKQDRKRLDRSFKPLAKALGPSRDATVRLVTARGVAERAGMDPPSRELEAFLLRGVDPPPHAAAPREPHGNAPRLLAAADRFDAARNSAGNVAWAPGGASELRSGLHRLHEDGRAAWRHVGDPPDAHRLHVCRRHVKHLGYALRLLEPAWPGVIGGEALEIDRLGDALGKDHDRSLLRAALLDPSVPDALRADVEALAAATDAETVRERQFLLPVAARLFDERPKGFGRRHAAWWSRWHEAPHT